MKAILPILICSAISAALGYYFGHITVPEDKGNSSTATVSSTASGNSGTATSAPSENAFTGSTAPAEPAPAAVSEVAPEPVNNSDEEAAESAELTPATETNDEEGFAERAALTVQTLTDTQGRTIQATIVKVMDADVKIRRADGLETTIPLNMLSEEDVEFCNYLRDQQEEEEEMATPDTSEGFDWDSYFNS